MKDNCYAYAIDLSLRKGIDGQFSEPLIFECQPFLSSNLGGNSRWSYKNALKKAFPNSNIRINSQGSIINISVPNAAQHILITNTEEISKKEFMTILQGKYTHIHTGSFQTEIDQLNNKVNQRLYLPDEVSPEYCILETHVKSEKLVEDISKYFTGKNISKIVLKSAINHEGQGNLFIDLTHKTALNEGVKKIQQLNTNSEYFLAEEQKQFPRISRKTAENKSNHLTYRLVGIANSEGDAGHFIATKSISSSLDSHQRGKMKCYFDEPGKTHRSQVKCLLEACGPKDKYFGKGDNKIDIDSTLMDKISKNMYQLYADIKSMTDEEFKQHIQGLVATKKALLSKKQRIDHPLPLVQREEIVNKSDTAAFSRACEANYEWLASSIAKDLIISERVNLKELTNYPEYRPSEQLETMLKVMEEEHYIKGLGTASKDQLKHCFENKLAPTLSKTFVAVVKANRAKKKDLAGNASQLNTQTNPTIHARVAAAPITAKEKLALEACRLATSGPSSIQSKGQTTPSTQNINSASRFQQAFFNEVGASSAETPSHQAEQVTRSKTNANRP